MKKNSKKVTLLLGAIALIGGTVVPMTAHANDYYVVQQTSTVTGTVFDEEGEPLDPNDEYKPLLKVVGQRYEFADIPEEVKLPQPKRYSKKRFSLALAKRGIFSAIDAWADNTEVIPGSGLTVKRVLADSWDMSDADDEFKAIRGVAEAQFGAAKIAVDGMSEIWARPLADGSVAMGLYNKTLKEREVQVDAGRGRALSRDLHPLRGAEPRPGGDGDAG